MSQGQTQRRGEGMRILRVASHLEAASNDNESIDQAGITSVIREGVSLQFLLNFFPFSFSSDSWTIILFVHASRVQGLTNFIR